MVLSFSPHPLPPGRHEMESSDQKDDSSTLASAKYAPPQRSSTISLDERMIYDDEAGGQAQAEDGQRRKKNSLEETRSFVSFLQ